MTTPFSYDVFLSHNSNDKPRVRRLADKLKAAGLRVWLDDWQIKPGDDIYLAVERGLEASRVQLLCLSPAALGSNWVTLERSTVLFRDPSNAGRRFVPLLLEDCELPDTLRRFKYVDLRQESEAAFQEILEACRGPEDSAAVDPRPMAKRLPGWLPQWAEWPRPSVPEHSSAAIAVFERKLVSNSGWVSSVAVSPDCQWVASGSDATVRISDLGTGKCRAELLGHVGRVTCVAIMPDGKSILSGSWDRTIRVWDVGTGRCVRVLEGHNHAVLSVVPMLDGRQVFSVAAGNNSSIKIWSIESGLCLKTIQVAQIANCADVSRDGTRALIGGNEGKMALWDLEAGRRIAVFRATQCQP
jgi:WD40 repeat protein